MCLSFWGELSSASCTVVPLLCEPLDERFTFLRDHKSFVRRTEVPLLCDAPFTARQKWSHSNSCGAERTWFLGVHGWFLVQMSHKKKTIPTSWPHWPPDLRYRHFLAEEKLCNLFVVFILQQWPTHTSVLPVLGRLRNAEVCWERENQETDPMQCCRSWGQGWTSHELSLG